MSKVILNESALLALLKKDPGADILEPFLGGIVMSTVSVSKAASELRGLGLSRHEIQQCLAPLLSLIVPFDEEQAFYATEIGQKGKVHIVSFSDRACLALGLKMHLPVYTTYKSWKYLPSPAPQVILIPKDNQKQEART